MHSYTMEENYFEKSIGCLFCFDQRIVSTSFHHNTNKLFDICCKYLHSAITSETQSSSDLLFEKENVPFCEKCLQSAVELSALIEQLDHHQRTISEFIFVFSLRILHRRKKSFPEFNENGCTRKIEEFDISGLPDVVDNDLESLADLAGAGAFSLQENGDDCQQIVDNCNVKNEISAGSMTCEDEFLVTASDVNVGQVEIENPLNDAEFCEDSFKLNNIIVTTSSSLSCTSTDERKNNKSKCLSKEEIANSRLPIVNLEQRELLQAGKINADCQDTESTLRIANVKSLNAPNRILEDRGVVNVGAAIKLESVGEDLREEMVEEVVFVEQKQYEGNAHDDESAHLYVHTAKRKKTRPRNGQTFSKFSTNKKYTCDVCGKTCSTKQYLITHMRIHTGENPFQCSVCFKCFNQSSNLYTHMKVHTKPHKCPTCGERFAMKTGLDRHISKHKAKTLQKSLDCSICFQSFKQYSALNRHMMQHKKSYKCQFCQKRYASQDKRDAHMMQHNDQELQCRVCEKSFASKVTLTVHENIHTGEKPYHCTVCFKSFRLNSSLYLHKKVHTKSNKCPICDKRFALKTGLDNHMSKHKGEKRHKCP